MTICEELMTVSLSKKFHPSRHKKIQETLFNFFWCNFTEIFTRKKTSYCIFRNFLYARGVTKKHGVGRETFLINSTHKTKYQTL
jgi:hypothetical protein